MQSYNFLGGTLHARKIREVADDRHRAMALFLYALLDMVESLSVPSYENNCAALCQLKCGGETYA
jgi:hypothetical protein